MTRENGLATEIARFLVAIITKYGDKNSKAGALKPRPWLWFHLPRRRWSALLALFVLVETFVLGGERDSAKNLTETRGAKSYETLV